MITSVCPCRLAAAFLAEPDVLVAFAPAAEPAWLLASVRTAWDREARVLIAGAPQVLMFEVLVWPQAPDAGLAVDSASGLVWLLASGPVAPEQV
jgi:hypothetical protein